MQADKRDMRHFFLFLMSFLVVFALALPFTSASSMGVSPPITEIIYTGEAVIEGSFTVFPTAPKNIHIYSSGELQGAITFNGETELKIYMDKPTMINFTLKLPANVPPGDIRTTIVSEQYFTPDEIVASGQYAAYAAIGHVVRVRIPSPGKYLETKMNYLPVRVDMGDVVYFRIDMLNFGTEDLTNLQTEVVVKDAAGETVSTKQTNKVDFLKTGERAQLRSYWETKESSAGIYTASATIEYGGAVPATPSTGVRIGDINIKIVNLSTDLSSSTGKILLDVESNWNEPIENVYAEIKVKENGTVVDTLRTSITTLDPWGKARLTAFWERRDLKPGSYSLEVYVYYFDKQARKQALVRLPELEKPAAAADNTALLLIAVVLVVVLLMNLVFWLILTRRSKGHEQSEVNANEMSKNEMSKIIR